MRTKKHVVIDRFGRILVPKSVRDALGMAPGTTLRMHVDDRGILLVPAEGGDSVALENGILVFRGEPSGSIEGAIEAQRRARDSHAAGGGR